MAYPLIQTINRHPVAGAFVATGALLAMLALATGAFPVRCLATSILACGSKPLAVAEPAVTAPFKPVEVRLTEDEPLDTRAAEVTPPTLTHNDLLNATFEVLKVELQSQQASADPASTAPKARVVKTVPIAPLTAVPPATQVAAAETAISDVTGTGDAAPEALGYAPTPEPVVVSSEPPLVETADSPSGSTATVKGSGANVRSLPSKSKSKVLFALAGGSKVTVSENDGGWLKVTSEDGRTGWIYEDYVAQ